MSRLYDRIKHLYQIALEKRASAARARGTTVAVSRDLPFEATPLCFGVIGTGHVFDRWMHDLQLLPASAGIHVKGIVAGHSDTAQKKAQKYGIGMVYPDYGSMLQDPDIQAVYVATPNHLHKTHVIQALQAGKHVLCEKPIAVNTDELREMFDAADGADRFLMEGLWMRTLPMIQELVKVVHSGVIGAIRYIDTSCCNSDDPEQFPSLFSATKAGGALMDVGCYGLHFIRLMINGEPALNSQTLSANFNVDHTSSALLRYENSLAVVTQSIGAAGGAKASLHGTKGSIEVPMFLSPEGFTVKAANGYQIHYIYEKGMRNRPIGYAYEILHFAQCIHAGLRNSDLIPRSETFAVARQMEQIRKKDGIKLVRELEES